MESNAAATASVDLTQVQALEEKVRHLEKRLRDLEARAPDDRVALVVFSGELDRVLAAFVIATGAAAMGQQVSMFFTFWGLSVLRKGRQLSGKTVFQKMMTLMSPRSSRSLPVSKMNYFGVGAKMLRSMMKDKKVSSLEEMSRSRGNGRANDRLRNVPGPDGDQRIRARGRPRVRRGRDLPGRLAPGADKPVHLNWGEMGKSGPGPLSQPLSGNGVSGGSLAPPGGARFGLLCRKQITD